LGKLPYTRLLAKSAPLVIGIGALLYAQKLPFGSWNDPGPGLWPICLSVLIIAVSLLLIFRKEENEETEPFTRDSWFPFYGVLSLIAFIVLFEHVGIIVPSLLTFLIWTRFFGRERWRNALALSVGLTALIYLLFAKGLEIPFPKDLLLTLFE